MSEKKKEKKEKKKVRRDVARVLNKGSFGKYVTLSDPYARSILDPFNEHGAKVPDFNDAPSATFTCVQRFKITGNSGGLAGCVFGLAGEKGTVPMGSLVPFANFQTPAPTWYTGGPVGCKLGTATTDANLFPTGAGGNSSLHLSQFQYSPTTGVPWGAIPEMFEKVRLVSCGAGINYLGNQLQSQGMFTVAAAPRNYSRMYLATDQAVSLDFVGQIPGSKIVPINTLKGASCTYRPIDEVSTTYCETDLRLLNSAITNDMWTGALAPYVGGELYLIASGLVTEDPPSFIVTLVVNYEGIPRTNTVDLTSSTPSPVDPIRFSNAMNKVSRVPTTVGQTDEIQGLEENGLSGLSLSKAVVAKYKPLQSVGNLGAKGSGQVMLRTSPKSHINENKNFIDTIGEYIDSSGRVVDSFFALNKKASSPLLKMISELGVL